MKKEKLEEYLGQRIKVTLFDGSEYSGELRSNSDYMVKNIPEYSYHPKCYHLAGPDAYLSFRCSHIKKVRLENEN